MIPWDTIATILSVLISIGSLAYWLGKKFAEINERFRTIDERFKTIDERFELIDERFRSIEKNLYIMNERLERLEQRVDVIEKRLSIVESEVKAIKQMQRNMPLLIQAIQSTIIDYMSLKGLFTKEEREYLIRELNRLIKAYMPMNPLKPEEAKFILEVLEEIKKKDPKEVDMSKVDKALEIIDRWLKEDMSREAMEAWIKMYTLRAILRKERGEF